MRLRLLFSAGLILSHISGLQWLHAEQEWTELSNVQVQGDSITVNVDEHIGACKIECVSGEVRIKQAFISGMNRKLTIEAPLKAGQSTAFAVDPSKPAKSIQISRSGNGEVKILVKVVTVTIPLVNESDEPRNLQEGGWEKIATITRKGGAAELTSNQNVSELMVKCDSGRIIVNSIVVNEISGSSTIPVAGVYAAGESEVIDIGGLRSLIGLRINHGGKGSYSIYGRP